MSGTVHVRMVAPSWHGEPGKILGVTAALAARWVAEGLAEYAESTPAETAMVIPPANAMRLRGQARRVGRR